MRAVSLDILCVATLLLAAAAALVAAEAATAAPERTLSAALNLRESMSLKALTLLMSLGKASYVPTKS